MLGMTSSLFPAEAAERSEEFVAKTVGTGIAEGLDVMFQVFRSFFHPDKLLFGVFQPAVCDIR